MRYQLIAILGVVFLLGCDVPTPTPSASQPATAPQATPVPPTTPAPLPPNVIKAEDATGVWNQGQVEQFVNEKLKLTTIALKSNGNNGYQGTGTDAQGLNYTLTVKQVAGGIKVDWSHSGGGTGKLTFGNPVP